MNTYLIVSMVIGYLILSWATFVGLSIAFPVTAEKKVQFNSRYNKAEYVVVPLKNPYVDAAHIPFSFVWPIVLVVFALVSVSYGIFRGFKYIRIPLTKSVIFVGRIPNICIILPL